MSILSRRNMLSGSASVAIASALAPAGTRSARSAVPIAGKQASGFYRYRVGALEVTVVTDGAMAFPVDTFVSNASPQEVKSALAAAYIDTDMLSVPFAPVVVNTGSKLVLIDTGLGDAAFAGSKGRVGQLAGNLKAAGIERADIDAVVISHFHSDHTNGLVGADGKPAFPNAEILVPAKEWAFWMDDGEMSRAPEGRMSGLFKNNRRVFDALGRKVTPYAWDKDVMPGLTAVGTPGHSTGHTSFILASGADKVFIQSDAMHIPVLFAANPGWHPFVDQDFALAEATRRKVFDMLAAEKMLVQGFHFPFPALAHIEKAGDGYRQVMVPWNPNI